MRVRHREAFGVAGEVHPGLADVLALTEREAQVGFWMAEAKTNAEIALILGMSRRTVEKHVEHVLTKLGVENRTAAAIRLRDDVHRMA